VNGQEPVPYPLPKGLFDKVVSGVLLLLLAPVLFLLFVAVALDMLLVRRDRGPWLYRERRVSRGREFDLLKFRTVRREVLEEARSGGYAQQLEGDPRNLTWMGRRVLKRWYLDELPQLWNILRGDMSLVGPRPWPPSMVRDQEAAGLDYRRLVQAGWTGPAQVTKGVPDTRYADLDLAYVDACRTWSSSRLVRYDLGILWKTVRVLVRGEGLRF
jgi:lipopolysaccharide/colanic/teichoic acid biosynthesis glycosyltransferase